VGKPGTTAIGDHLAIRATRGGLSMNTPIADDFPAIAAGMGEDLPAGSDTSSSTTDELTERASASLNTLDCELVDLDAASRLLGHLSTTDHEISGSELVAVQMMVERAHDQIEARYNRLREIFREQQDAHRADLAKAQEAKAAPGSRQDVERAATMWRLLRVIANAALERCDEAQGITAAGNANG
jgi:hypothetical protein